jgi:septum site-determining protein MinD
MRKIAIVSGKGGIGKTTLALNIVYLLHNKYNFDTTAVDCNMTTPHLSTSLGFYNNERTLNQVLLGKLALNEATTEHPVGIKMIPASTDLVHLEGVDMNLLGTVLAGSSTNMILDCAPGIGREGVASMKAADEILYVTQPHKWAVADISRCNQIADMLNKKVLGIVVNCRKAMPHELKRSEIEAMTEIPVLAEIPYDLDLERSAASRLPLELYNSKSPANRSFHNICAEITGMKLERPKGFFERTLGLRLLD